MHVLVTGGAGFIGSHIVDALIARGDRVAVLDDMSNGRRENLAGALERGAILHAAERLVDQDPRVRAEELSLEDFLALAERNLS